MSGHVDLNADLGESVERWESGADVELLEFVTSANVSTGAYAGTDELIRDTCAAALSAGVRIGAQVGYRDPEGFGRRPVDIDVTDLVAEIRGQLEHLSGLAELNGARIAYVKPHGALYHRVHRDPRQAEALVTALLAHDPLLQLMGMPDAVSLELATGAGVATLREGFADRAYTPEGLLVDRSLPGALLESPFEAARQAVDLAGRVDSICLHSDSPGVLDLVREVRAALVDADIEVDAK